MQNRQVTVFNKQAIASLEANIEESKKIINENEQKTIPAHQQKIDDLTPLFQQYAIEYKRELERYHFERAPLESKKSGIEGVIRTKRSEIEHEEKSISELESNIRHIEDRERAHAVADAFNSDRSTSHLLVDVFESMSDSSRINEYRKDIRACTHRIIEYRVAIQNLQDKLNAVRSAIDIAERNHEQTTAVQNYNHQKQLIEQEKNKKTTAEQLVKSEKESIKKNQAKIREITGFLAELKQSPVNVFNRLSYSVLEEFKTYQESDPAHQTQAIHIAALELPKKIEFIANNDVEIKHEPAEGATVQIDAWHKKHACLVGYLWNLYNRDQALQFLVFPALQNTHIAENGSLPDELQFESCAAVYDTFKAKHRQAMRDFTMNDVENEYDSIRDSLQENLRGKLLNCSSLERSFYEKCKAVVAATERARLTTGTRFNKTLYTRVLKQTATVLENPTNLTELRKYENLGKLVDGQRSCCKLVSGAILAVVGLTLAAVGAVFIARSILDIGIDIPAITLGAGLTVIGILLASTGSLRGTANSIFSVVESASKQSARRPQVREGVDEDINLALLEGGQGATGAPSAPWRLA